MKTALGNRNTVLTDAYHPNPMSYCPLPFAHILFPISHLSKELYVRKIS